MVQFVADGERKVQIEAVRIRVADANPGAHEGAARGPADDEFEHRGRQRTHGDRQLRITDETRSAHVD
jgi:hypothetical protein